MQEMQEDAGSIPGSGRSPRGGHGNPLQYSCLENPMDRGAWWAVVHGVAELDPIQHACMPKLYLHRTMETLPLLLQGGRLLEKVREDQKGKQFSQGHTARKGQPQNPNSGLGPPRAMFIIMGTPEQPWAPDRAWGRVGTPGRGRWWVAEVGVGTGSLRWSPWTRPGPTSPADTSRKEKVRRRHIVMEGPGLC